MINKNQYEKSVIMLKEHVPIFVRNAYNSFVTCLDELSSEYMAEAQKESPYSIDKVCKNLFINRDFMKVYNNALPDDVLKLKLYKIVSSIATFDSPKSGYDNKNEEFYTVNGPDIYAPVKAIKPALTVFSADYTWHKDCEKKVIPLSFEIERSHNVTETELRVSEGDKLSDLVNEDIEGFNGVKTILDDLSTTMVVDLAALFDLFFASLAKDYAVDFTEGNQVDSIPTRFIEHLVKLSEAAKQANKSTAIVELVTDKLFGSAISTYFVYASKLVGSKNDIYQWMYTSFVKDSVTSFDEIYYPTKAPVTLDSGHAVIGEMNGDNISNQRNIAGNPQIQSHPTNNDDELTLKKIMIYRNIRMQYSVWASVINAVLSSKIKWGCSFEKYANSKEKDVGLPRNRLCYNTLCLARDSLYAYIKARYRTYNLTQQVDPITGVPYQSVKNINIAVDRVKDEEAIAIIKSAIAGKTIEKTLIATENVSYNVSGINNLAVNTLSKFVLRASYLVLMSKMVESLGKAKDVIEPQTGRPKKDVFAEVFYGILNKLKNDFDYYSRNSTDYRLEDITDSVYKLLTEISIFYSPLTGFKPCEDRNFEIYHLRKDHFVTETLNTIVSELEETTYNLDRCTIYYFNEICSIPLFSDIRILEFSINDQFTVFDTVPRYNVLNMNNKNDQVIFPKNRLILEGIEKMNFDSHRSFASLESVNNAIDNLQTLSEMGFEGADAMASNSVYSSLAGVCSGITSLEITNEETAAKDHLTVNDDGGIITEGVNTDADGNINPEGPKDPYDQASLTQHSVESAHQMIEATLEHDLYANASERFNKIFNTVVLGMK